MMFGDNERSLPRVALSVLLAAGLGLAPLAGCGNAQQAQPAATTEAAAFDVAGALGSLAFDGRDVSVDATKVLLGVSADGNVVVTEATSDDDATVVANTCERAAALSACLEGATVSRDGGEVAATRATWVSTAPDGSVTCAVSYEAGKAPESGTTEELVKGSNGYTMSDAAHDAAGLPSDLPATGGDAVTDGSGAAVTPGQAPADSGSQPAAGDAAPGDSSQSGSQQQGSGASSSASPSSSGSGSAAKPGSGGQSQASGSSSSSSSGSGSSSKPAHQHSWQAVYRDEPVYGQQWVSNWVYTRHPRFYVNHGGTEIGPFDNDDAAYDWIENDYLNGGIGGSVVDDSYTTKEDQGHYETVQTGTRQVLDHYECPCGARK